MPRLVSHPDRALLPQALRRPRNGCCAEDRLVVVRRAGAFLLQEELRGVVGLDWGERGGGLAVVEAVAEVVGGGVARAERGQVEDLLRVAQEAARLMRDVRD